MSARNSKGELDGGKFQRKATKLADQAMNLTKANRNDLQADSSEAKNLWGYRGQDSYFTRLQFPDSGNTSNIQRGVPSKYLPDYEKEGLADMSTANALDKKMDTQNWYSRIYGGLNDKDGKKHGEDLGKAYVTSEYFAYLEKKKEEEFAKQFEIWKLNQVDLSNPALRTYWQRRMPELVTKKLQFYENRSRIEAAREEIKIRGPDSMNDLRFMYLDNLGVFDTSTPESINTYMNNRQTEYIWDWAVKNGQLLPGTPLTWNTDQKMVPSVPLNGP